MGYEVLDSSGRATDGPAGARPPHLDVLDLDLGLDAGIAPRDDQPEPWGPQARRWLAAAAATGGRAVVAGVRAVAAAPLTVRRTLAVVTSSLLVGGLVGAAVMHRHDDGAGRRAQRAVLAVDASGTDVNVSTGPDTVAIINTVRVTNHGPLPVRVVTGTSRTGLVVAATGTTDVAVPAGARGTVTATFVVDCQAATLVPVPVLQVRTADGRRHDVPLEIGVFGGTPVREAVCEGSQGRGVDASLSGSVQRPVLRLTNPGAHDQRVTLPSVLMSDADGRPLVTATTVPAGPLVVPGRGLRDVRLTVRVARCPREVAALTGIGYLSLDVAPTDGGAPTTGGQGVDLGPLVGVALARACSR